VVAAEFAADFGEVLRAQQTRGDSLEGIDKDGGSDLRRHIDQEVNMVVFAVALAQFSAEVGTDGGERLPETVANAIGSNNIFAVLSDKDQMVG
jgi:hypothetical protein